MGVSTNNKRTFQEFRYIKIPDRRLISGLLYVNVVNHEGNDAQDDLIQQCNDHTVGNGIKHSNSFSSDGSSAGTFQDRGREGMKHTFADYDCFVFHVAGGMSLSGGIASPTTAHTTYNNLSSLVSNGFVDNTGPSPTWVDGSGTVPSGDQTRNWTTLNDNSGENPFGDYCSHFIKYHLLSRINNASGHGLNQSSRPNFYKSRPMHVQTYTSPAGVVNLADPATVTNEYVLSHGIYDDKDTQGEDLGMASYSKPGHGVTGFTRIESSVRTAGESQAADGTISNNDGNTYYSPVDTIKIYGNHNLTFESHSTTGTPGSGSFRRVYSYDSSRSSHITSFWNLVIDIGLRGNNPQGAATQTGNPDKAILRPQINVSFQPFGETANFDISETQHT
tara:strand:+ start:3622 stop:4791 length:1170 start_codon:yes stop_codon:yes gene_type:complete